MAAPGAPSAGASGMSLGGELAEAATTVPVESGREGAGLMAQTAALGAAGAGASGVSPDGEAAGAATTVPVGGGQEAASLVAQTWSAVEPCLEDLFSEGPSEDEGDFWDAVEKDCDARAKQQEAQALLLVSRKLREDALRTREARAQLGPWTPSTPQKAKLTLISRFTTGTPSPPAVQEGPLEGRRGRRGAKHPCYMNAEERELATKKAAIRQQDEALRVEAIQLETQAKAAEELSKEAAAVASQAIAILEKDDAGSDLAKAAEVLQVIGRRGRGRPPHTAEQGAAAQERKAKVKAQKGKLEPEDRERVQTPSATARSMIVNRVDALSKQFDNYTTNEFWTLAEDLCGVPASMLKRFAKPEEREKLSRYLDARGPERSERDP